MHQQAPGRKSQDNDSATQEAPARALRCCKLLISFYQPLSHTPRAILLAGA